MTEEGAESLRRVHMLVGTGRYGQALAEIDPFVGRHPGLSAGWRLKAFCHLALHQLPDSYEAARQCLRIDPDDTAALNMLGQSLLLGGRADEALRVFNDLVARKPEEGVGHLLAAEALTRLHLSMGVHNPRSLNTIHEALTRAGTLDADRASAHSQAGDMYRELNLLSHAEAAYRRALELEPQHEGALRGLSAVDALRGRLRGAAAHSALLMSLNPRARGAARIMYTGIARTGLRVNRHSVLAAPFALLTGALTTSDDLGPLLLALVVTLSVTAPSVWHVARIVTIPANVRRYMRGFDGFTGWMTGLVLMPASLLLLGLVPDPWGLYGLALLLAAYLWQRHGRNLVWADLLAREAANERSAAR
ncbi:tetratricopeptide repeat protein [Nocardiopsis quinghaiensis]|uniref:tetratricopeptide repeat protein n=1 Tax=Nocardiopsis quinghaiensis TaxID=464995 RepID=UPI00123AFA0D|nr:tetratricopeptide repeat protein [Nocardiopsis quinghaiensis]